MNFREATPIQEKAIPPILKDKDLIACAQTGTGKTAAYLLPLLHKLVKKGREPREINTIVLVPTRELALQIDQQLEGFSYFLPVSSKAIYGGGDASSWSEQRNAIERGVDILISTPGRLIQHLNMGYVKVDKVEHLVLDEADRMLDMGFYDDIMKIIKQLPLKRQTLLFSATMPHKIRKLAHKILVAPQEVNLAVSKPAEGIDQRIYFVFDEQKIPLVEKLLKESDFESIIIFTSTKKAVNDLHKALKSLGSQVKGIHSDFEQNEREEVLRLFKNKQIRVLIATDILSRGIDVEDINLVLNFDVPHDGEDYVHRIGRTARASTTGVAITLVNPKNQQRFFRIERMFDEPLKKINLPEELGEGPEIQTPKAKRKNYAKKSKSKQKRKFGSKNRQPRNKAGNKRSSSS
ncbi:DEAD/DEAH box helicase [Cytophagales bacterium RKSG123]|nr:DEAD/DEAH box helicase [Xanthovirga aplysinae]